MSRVCELTGAKANNGMAVVTHIFVQKNCNKLISKKGDFGGKKGKNG